MTTSGTVLVGVVIAVGLLGVLLPVLPGLLLVEGAGLWWVLADGGGTARWLVFAVMTAFLLAGTAAKYVLPARAAAARGAPLGTLLVGAAAAVAGFFVIPVVGVVVGGVLGIFLAELARFGGDTGRAWASTRAALVGIGVGVLVELAAGLAMALAWLVGVLVT